MMKNDYLEKYYNFIKIVTITKYTSTLLASKSSELQDINIEYHTINAILDNICISKNLRSTSALGETDQLPNMLESRNNYTMSLWYLLENNIGFLFDIDVKEWGISHGGDGPTIHMCVLFNWTPRSAFNARCIQYRLIDGVLKDNEILPKRNRCNDLFLSEKWSKLSCNVTNFFSPSIFNTITVMKLMIYHCVFVSNLTVIVGLKLNSFTLVR